MESLPFLGFVMKFFYFSIIFLLLVGKINGIKREGYPVEVTVRATITLKEPEEKFARFKRFLGVYGFHDYEKEALLPKEESAEITKRSLKIDEQSKDMMFAEKTKKEWPSYFAEGSYIH
ncbi:unnamed protein product [Bursaphelenchus xylophilus]|uniref:(pine wood nematode) hypothetical protein n=1 Tax=Bursaphelenchus xylophilus TaxID=6326 RepID=A0A1I7SUR8_BURXY|nr:unnamed protein product [Bursaphelenchus xylophilus]CAG9125915.1 unnamed protein product [Bursaphelenchus xylophilus]